MKYLIAIFVAGALITSWGNNDIDPTLVNKVMYNVMSDDRAVRGYELEGDTLVMNIRVSNPEYSLAHYGFNSSYKSAIKKQTGVSKVVFK